MCACRGLCSRYRAEKPPSGGRYSQGQKRCQECEIYMITAGILCPCCNMRLRTKPRNLKCKEKYREAEKNGEIVSHTIDYEALRKKDDLEVPLGTPLELPVDEIS